MPDDFSMFDLPQQDPVAKPDDKTTQPTMVTLTKEQFDQLMSSQNEERRRNQELWAQVFQAPKIDTTPQQPKFEINLDGLPDPRDDLEGYHKGLAARMGETITAVQRATVDQTEQRLNSNQSQAALLDRAYQRLQERHPELVDFPEIVESAANVAFGEMRSRGADPLRLLNTNMDDIVDQVAERGKGLLGRIRGEQANDDNADSGRANVLGGSAAKPRGRKASADDYNPNDLVASLHKQQREMGLY